MIAAESVALWAHVLTGTVAVVAGLGALTTTKGGRRHRLAGRWFVRAMAGVVASVLALVALAPTTFREFLTLVAVFSGYLAFSGYRALSRKRPSDAPAAVDWAAAVVGLLACLALAGWGVVRLRDGGSLGVVMLVFGGIGVALAGSDLRAFRDGGREGWTVTHLQRMVAAFVATVSAVSAVNLASTLGVLAWLWPTIVGTPLIAYWARTYGQD